MMFSTKFAGAAAAVVTAVDAAAEAEHHEDTECTEENITKNFGKDPNGKDSTWPETAQEFFDTCQEKYGVDNMGTNAEWADVYQAFNKAFGAQIGNVTCGKNSPQIECFGGAGLKMLEGLKDDEDEAKEACENFLTPKTYEAALFADAKTPSTVAAYLKCLAEEGQDDDDEDNGGVSENVRAAMEQFNGEFQSTLSNQKGLREKFEKQN
eukprot:gene841-866_t